MTSTLVRQGETQLREGAIPPASPDMTIAGPPFTRDYFGRYDEVASGPQAFMLDPFPPESTVGAHFHTTNQFQIFFPSSGAWYQRSPIDDVLLHYADAYTTYGPFGSGASPLTFLTLRQQASTMTGYMPGARSLLRQKPRRRHIRVDLGSVSPAARPIGSSACTLTALIEDQDDGLSAHLVDAPPGAQGTVPGAAADGGGQYCCVISGALEIADRRCEELAVGWADPGSSATPFTASADGCRLLVMQFPQCEP